MANIKEHYLAELRVSVQFLEDAVKAVLHTIMFVRSPLDIEPQDRTCEALFPLTYTTVGPSDVDRDVMGTIDQVKREMLSGSSHRKEILLSFFEHREVKEWMGLVNRTETVYFERWHIPVTSLGTTQGPPGDTDLDPESAYHSAYEQVRKAVVLVLECANQASDHMPLLYQYELQVLDLEESRRRASFMPKAI